jgi:hypothetical protein
MNMRGIARTDRLVRLVMWAALAAAAWMLFAPGKADASENPVQDVVRSATSLTGAVLEVVPQHPAGDATPASQGTGSPAGSAASSGRATPGGHAASAHSAASAPSKAASEPLASVSEPLLKPVAATTSALAPVVGTTARSVRTVVDGTVDAVDATIEPVPVLAPVVRDATEVLVGVVDALPVVGADPVVELPVPGLPSTSGLDPSSPAGPASPSSEPAVAGGPVPSGPAPMSDRSLAPVEPFRSPAAGTSVAVTAQSSAGTALGPVAAPAARAGAETSAGVRPSEPTPWPTESPIPAMPAPAQSSASFAGQSHGPDTQADVPFVTLLGAAGSATIAAIGQRAPGALNAQPAPRPD